MAGIPDGPPIVRTARSALLIEKTCRLCRAMHPNDSSPWVISSEDECVSLLNPGAELCENEEASAEIQVMRDGRLRFQACTW
jgi:hypothetical protein